jgi:hypothetical protein
MRVREGGTACRSTCMLEINLGKMMMLMMLMMLEISVLHAK